MLTSDLNRWLRFSVTEVLHLIRLRFFKTDYRGWGNGELLFNGQSLTFARWKGSGGLLHNNVNILDPSELHLKMVKVVNFMCLLPQFLKYIVRYFWTTLRMRALSKMKMRSEGIFKEI